MRLTFDLHALDQSSTVSSSGRSSERSVVGRARCSLPPTRTLVEVLSLEARSEATRTEGRPQLACSTRLDGVSPDPPADHYLDLRPRSQLSNCPSRPPFFLAFAHTQKTHQLPVCLFDSGANGAVYPLRSQFSSQRSLPLDTPHCSTATHSTTYSCTLDLFYFLFSLDLPGHPDHFSLNIIDFCAPSPSWPPAHLDTSRALQHFMLVSLAL